jgi:NAD(P)-dependent dehydrogenase (short-subunit alcohol dehydrogenase family)
VIQLWPVAASKDKTALITGASSGIGLLTAVELARAGFRVIATMRDLGRREHLDRAAADAAVSDRIDVRRLDVTDFPAIAPLVASVIADYGRIDLLVNNAGFALGGFAEDIQLDELRAQFETNFFAQVAVTRAVLPQMRLQRAGHIIMVSSISGRIAGPGRSSYSASKFALEGWTESLRMETHSLGIRAVLVEPGPYATDIWERNIQLGQAVLSEASPNRANIEKLRAFMEKLPRRDPREVARLITRIAQAPNPKLRYLAGREARLHTVLRALVPWKIYEKLVARKLGME